MTMQTRVTNVALFGHRKKALGVDQENAEPKCEKPWFVSNNDLQKSHLIKKKDKHMKMSKSYGHKVSDENCECVQDSRLCGTDHRQTWSNGSCDSKSKQEDCQNAESSDDENNMPKNSEAPSEKRTLLHVSSTAKKYILKSSINSNSSILELCLKKRLTSQKKQLLRRSMLIIISGTRVTDGGAGGTSCSEGLCNVYSVKK